jgi:thiol-disulfide isomerase/thioredoxin
MKTIEVRVGNEEKLQKLLKDTRPTVMLYHMSMCPHCVAMRPAWEQVKKKIEAQNGVMVAEVEYSQMHVLPASLKNIRGFPTIQVLEKGKVKSEYVGDRTAQSIVEFAMSHVKKPTAKPKAAAAKPKKTA